MRLFCVLYTRMQIAYNNLSEAYRLRGNYKEAIENIDNYHAIKDSIFSKENNKKILEQGMKYEYEKKAALAKADQEKKDALAMKELQKQKLVRNGFIGGFAVVLLFAGVFFGQRNRIKQGKKQSDELLLNILPAEVAEELKTKGRTEAKLIDEVTVLFTDFKGFTQLSEKLSPQALVSEINDCFSAFDHIMQKYGVEKIKTIGDSYMAAGGLPTPNKTHPDDVVRAALEIQKYMHEHKLRKESAGELFFEIRIGVHTGPVVAGIVGVKKFQYDIWGDTVNTASRMESSGGVGKVNISGATYELVKDKFNCEYRGEIDAKGKGELKMYFVS
jgi:adenylate cyclase